MLRVSVSISLPLIFAIGIRAQNGLETILQGLEKHKTRLDKSIDQRRVAKHCPATGLWALHIPTVSLLEPQSQQDFISGAFTKHLVPNERPSRWGKRGRIGMASYFFDSGGSFVAAVSMGYTFTLCNRNPSTTVTDYELASVYRDSVPAFIVGVYWGSVSGFLYQTASGWYLISYGLEGLRNEPFERALQRSWSKLQEIGYGVGPWDPKVTR